jgi:hypothetical protein
VEWQPPLLSLSLPPPTGERRDNECRIRITLTRGMATHTNGMATHTNGMATHTNGMVTHTNGMATHTNGMATHTKTHTNHSPHVGQHEHLGGERGREGEPGQGGVVGKELEAGRVEEKGGGEGRGEGWMEGGGDERWGRGLEVGGQRAAPDVDGNGSGTWCAHMDLSTHKSSKHMDKRSFADPRLYRSLAEPRPFVSSDTSTPFTVSPDMSMHMGRVPRMTLTSTNSPVTPDTWAHLQTAFQPLKRRGVNYLF